MGLLKKFIRLFVPERQLLRIWYWLYGIRGLFYKGTQRYCVCCNGHFSTFFPYGDTEKRANALCPRCRSMERQRLLWMYLENKTSFLSRPVRLLHFAPEPVLEKKIRQQSMIDYLTADIEPHLAMRQEDIQQLSFPDNSFDLILCSHVLAVVNDDQKAMSELYRVVKPGGTVIIQERYDVDGPTVEDTAVTTDEERTRVYGKPYLQRLYGTDLHKRIEEAGFSVVVTRYLDEFTQDQKETFGLGNKEEIYLAQKKSKESSFEPAS